MYLVTIIIINFTEDFNRSSLELRLDLKSPELELELELKSLELELELIVSSGIGIGIGIENNGIGIGIELKKWNWPQPCRRDRWPWKLRSSLAFASGGSHDRWCQKVPALPVNRFYCTIPARNFWVDWYPGESQGGTARVAVSQLQEGSHELASRLSSCVGVQGRLGATQK